MLVSSSCRERSFTIDRDHLSSNPAVLPSPGSAEQCPGIQRRPLGRLQSTAIFAEDFEFFFLNGEGRCVLRMPRLSKPDRHVGRPTVVRSGVSCCSIADRVLEAVAAHVAAFVFLRTEGKEGVLVRPLIGASQSE